MAEPTKSLRGKIVDQNEETPIYEAAKKAAKRKKKVEKKKETR